MTAIARCQQIWIFRNNIIYGGMSKLLSHAQLVVIDALQFVDYLITPSIQSSKFGCDSLRMIGIKLRGPTPKLIQLRDWDPPAVGRCALHCVGILSSIALIGGIIRDCKGGCWGVVAGSVGWECQNVADLLAVR